MSALGERQAATPATPKIAVFCDFENVAIGVTESQGGTFDMRRVLARLLDKGQVLVKRAYADWHRYRQFRRVMHEAAFELVEVPHVSYSGKNSADIRLVVDALDLCYSKPHIDLFAVVSGDSDFSPLVAKLRENDKTVVGVGVRSSTSDLLVEGCDEFIYYDDLGPPSEGGARATQSAGARDEAVSLVVDTLVSLARDRDGDVWGSMIKQTIKRKRPNFDEGHFGYHCFSDLLEDAGRRGQLQLEGDRRSGGYRVYAR